MNQRVIPLADERQLRQIPSVPTHPVQPTGRLADTRQRLLKDLRISVTDRCNFRCVYCMPKEVFDKEHAFLPRKSLLSFEEITRLARLFAAHGVTKIRLTGGEPLLRRGIEDLIAQLVAIPDMEVTLTTNGVLLPKKAVALKAAGLRRITISLDSLDDAVFRAMNDVDVPVADVLHGIAAAEDAGLGPLKINMVVKRGLNDHEILPMARHFRDSGHILRFIEFMDVGSSNGWRMDDVVPSAEVIRRIHGETPLEAIDPNYPGEVAERWRYRDGGGEIGVISSVTQAFCATCTRARLSTEGQLYTCLFAQSGHDLRTLLRAGHSDAVLSGVIGQIWSGRGDRYSEIRTAETAALRKIEMSYIGG
ncbi:GTP 3',8-cyclase MoaA [Zoogloea sp.]|uniref:GTP 3',8-cyclase MoaA n=1 Tax=Zoogloea sp. TaxID=49181 RepID=UPI00260B4322|nr:GTP 3',8-cyclase MoaA [Zoogloea sp.]MDD3354345.1 GTP 3',8-cyclase MoaA [Zoogloea sp.]